MEQLNFAMTDFDVLTPIGLVEKYLQCLPPTKSLL